MDKLTDFYVLLSIFDGTSQILLFIDVVVEIQKYSTRSSIAIINKKENMLLESKKGKREKIVNSLLRWPIPI